MTSPSNISKIIYEDDDCVVIDKPSGMLVHDDGRGGADTVVDWFLAHVPSARGTGESAVSQTGEPLERSGVVHRLDTETSGVLILAKHNDAHTHLKAEFHDRNARKEYRAFVYGQIQDQWGTIDRPIGRSAKDWRKRSAERGAKGTLRDAVTDYQIVTTGTYQDELFSELILRPKTGRTHQLRVHLKALSRPIVRDTLYAGGKLGTGDDLEFSRLALHAHTLTLTLPSGVTQTFTAPIPESFIEAHARIAGVE